MQIKDLPLPITAAKADWLPGTHWVGFTPRDGSTNAREQCRSTVYAQFQGGYVIEYVTFKFDDPNPGFERDSRYLAEKAAHAEVAGKLISVHRLRPSARPLREILGDAEYEQLQDMWAESGKRHRWSVAFPILESYKIVPAVAGNKAFSAEAYTRLFKHPSATLRPLNDDERDQINHLVIEAQPTPNAWIGIADEADMAERSETPRSIVRLVDQDLAVGAFEGLTDEQVAEIRKRAAWLAHRFVLRRRREGTLVCDDCGFDPQSRISNTGLSPRALLDVHHMNPLDEGLRYTTEADFCLVCPNCHRFMHRLAASLSNPVEKAHALHPRNRSAS
jgi:5-methylcytosine-specific restriction enzyme A